MVLTTFAGCQNSELKQSITTEYGDHLKIHAYLSGNLHKRYFTCKIYCDGTESFAYFSFENSPNAHNFIILISASSSPYNNIDENCFIYSNLRIWHNALIPLYITAFTESLWFCP